MRDSKPLRTSPLTPHFRATAAQIIALFLASSLWVHATENVNYSEPTISRLAFVKVTFNEMAHSMMLAPSALSHGDLSMRDREQIVKMALEIQRQHPGDMLFHTIGDHVILLPHEFSATSQERRGGVYKLKADGYSILTITKELSEPLYGQLDGGLLTDAQETLAKIFDLQLTKNDDILPEKLADDRNPSKLGLSAIYPKLFPQVGVFETLVYKKISECGIDRYLNKHILGVLSNADIETIGDLVSKHEAEMLKYRNFGKRGLSLLKDGLAQFGQANGVDLHLGMYDDPIVIKYLEKKSALRLRRKIRILTPLVNLRVGRALELSRDEDVKLHAIGITTLGQLMCQELDKLTLSMGNAALNISNKLRAFGRSKGVDLWVGMGETPAVKAAFKAFMSNLRKKKR